MSAREKSKHPANRASGPVRGTTQEAQRLQKVLAAAGIGSRRHCEQLIQEGRVEVDRLIVTQLGTRVDLSSQEVRVDGQALRRPRLVYFLVNKPTGVVSTSRDPAGRTRVVDLIGVDERLFTVGRLDRSSEGLILVTNDGEIAHRLIHPRYGLERTYHVVVAGGPTRQGLDTLRRGVHLAEGRVQVARLRVKQRRKASTVLEMVLTEGRNREIRRMAARIGHKVMSLKRIGFGPLRLGDLPPGAFRELTRAELRKLRDLVHRQTSGELPSEPSRKARPPSPANRAGSSRQGKRGSRRDASRTTQGRAPRRQKGRRR